MKGKKLFIIVGILAILLSLSFFIFLLGQEKKSKALPILGQVNDGRFIDTQKKSFHLAELKGKVWVADFIFTTCPGICPVMTRTMAQLYRSYRLTGNVHFVSFSVNPENDTPEVLRKYAQNYDADPSLWHFLTGSRDALTDVAVKDFKLGMVNEPVFHSGKFILVDKNLQIRGYYEHNGPEELNLLFRDINELLKE